MCELISLTVGITTAKHNHKAVFGKLYLELRKLLFRCDKQRDDLK